MRDEAHADIVAKLYDDFGMPRAQYQWHCSCGRDKRAMEADIGHTDACSLELPNFKHKPSGLEVRWYKWIGRDTEVTNADGVDINAILAECMASLRAAS